MIYRLILKLRHRRYDKGRKKSFEADVPTICVGNITVGGTGKTPHTELILEHLCRGERQVAVLSRGYRRRSKGFQQVCTDGTAAFCGDEPLQIKKKYPEVTVAVDKDRVEGCEWLAHPDRIPEMKKKKGCRDRNFPPAELIVLDDAFQYRRLRAGLNIVLVDSNRPIDKDRLLPFGRLRDLPSRISAADVVIVTKCDRYLEDSDKLAWAARLGIRDYDTLTSSGKSKDGRPQSLFFTCIDYCKPVPLYDRTDPRYSYSKNLILFSGIANDGPLLAQLSDGYKILEDFRFSDHHRYTDSDIRQILAASKAHPTAVVMTTEKDAQRVLDYWKMPDHLIERLMYVPIKAAFLSEDEEKAFNAILDDFCGRPSADRGRESVTL